MYVLYLAHDCTVAVFASRHVFLFIFVAASFEHIHTMMGLFAAALRDSGANANTAPSQGIAASQVGVDTICIDDHSDDAGTSDLSTDISIARTVSGSLESDTLLEIDTGTKGQ